MNGELMKKEEIYKVRAFRCKRPPRWYENYLGVEFIEGRGGPSFQDQFPRYWIDSKDMPEEIAEATEGVGRHYAIRFEDSEIIHPNGVIKRLWKNLSWLEVDEDGNWTEEAKIFGKYFDDQREKALKGNE